MKLIKGLKFKVVIGVMGLSLLLVISAWASELEYYSMWNKGEPHQIAFDQIISDFEKLNPEIKVKVVWAGRAVMTKIRPRVLAGNPPDITDQAGSELYAALVLSDSAQPLNDLLKEKVPDTGEKLIDILKPQSYELFQTVKGNLYIIPYEVITSGIWYDGRLFAKFGFQVPETWDELMKIARTFKKEGIAPFTVDGTVDFYNAYWFYWVANRVLGADAFHEAAGDKTGKSWDNPEWLEVVKRIEQISPRGEDLFEEGFEGSSWPSAQIGWVQGRSAMKLMGTWLPNETKKSAPEEFEYHCFAFPKVGGGKGILNDVEIYPIGFGILRDAENTGAAREFIKFVLTKESQRKIVKIAENMASRKGLLPPPELRDAQEIINNATKTHRIYDGVQADFPEWWMKIFLKLDNQLLFGRINGKDFLSQIKEKTIEFWREKEARGEKPRMIPLR